MDREESIRERQRLYGSKRVRMIPKGDPDDKPETEDTTKEDWVCIVIVEISPP